MDSMILQVFTPEDLAAVEGHLKDLNQISSIEDVLSGVCDCSFLYFYRDLFPEFIESLYQANLNSAFSRIQLVLSALSDPERIIKHVQHLEKDETSGLTACFEGYQKYVLGVMKEEYIDPICEIIEVDLRYVIRTGISHEFVLSVCSLSYIEPSVSLLKSSLTHTRTTSMMQIGGAFKKC